MCDLKIANKDTLPVMIVQLKMKNIFSQPLWKDEASKQIHDRRLFGAGSRLPD
jgi:hypothetical protein